jgi:hypothetical protein
LKERADKCDIRVKEIEHKKFIDLTFDGVAKEACALFRDLYSMKNLAFD